MAKKAREVRIDETEIAVWTAIWQSRELSLEEKLKKTIETLPEAEQKILLVQLEKYMKEK